MKRRKYVFEKFVLSFLKVLISCVFAGGVAYCWIQYYNAEAPIPYYRLGYYFLFVIALASYVFIANIYGAFHVGTAPIIDILFSQVISIFIWQIICYIVFCFISYAIVDVIPFLLMFIIFSAFAFLWALVADKIYYTMHKPKKTLVVFNNVDSYLSLKGIRSMDKRFNVVKTVSSNKVELTELFPLVMDVEAVFLCGLPSDYRNEVVKFCVANKKIAYVKPKISDTIIRGGRTIQLLNIPVYRCSRADNSFAYQFMKRIIDVAFALVAIILSSPIMLVSAIAIKAYDHGPVFYKQERYTKDKKIFRVIKFRSMRVDAEKDGVARLASENDDRITPVGKILRKLRLDELPQVFNILGGSMSVVGPRPERPEISQQYEKNMPEFALRLQVKAGLTGYAQVYGKYNTPPYDKVQMDLMYITNQSIIQDIKLILLTFKIMFVPDSTEGVKDGQVTADRKNK